MMESWKLGNFRIFGLVAFAAGFRLSVLFLKNVVVKLL